MKNLLIFVLPALVALNSYANEFSIYYQNPDETKYIKISAIKSTIVFKLCDSELEECEIIGPQNVYLISEFQSINRFKQSYMDCSDTFGSLGANKSKYCKGDYEIEIFEKYQNEIKSCFATYSSVFGNEDIANDEDSKSGNWVKNCTKEYELSMFKKYGSDVVLECLIKAKESEKYNLNVENHQVVFGSNPNKKLKMKDECNTDKELSSYWRSVKTIYEEADDWVSNNLNPIKLVEKLAQKF